MPIPSSDERVLRASVIYGANAAGKSNLVKAIDFAKDLIIEGAGPMKRIARARNNGLHFITLASDGSSGYVPSCGLERSDS